jgi:putative transposase
VGHLLQGRFKSLLVEKETYLQELCHYVVLNPVRAGLVADAGGWAWSSYPATAGLRDAPNWLDVSAVLSLFHRNMATARTAYRCFVAEGMTQPSPWKDLRGQIFLGSLDFRECLERLLQGKPLINVPILQTCPTRLSPDEILDRVATAYPVPVHAVVDRSHREAYQTAVYLLRRVANEPLQTVANRFRISPSRISKIQNAIEAAPRSSQQARVFTTCNVKN